MKYLHSTDYKEFKRSIREITKFKHPNFNLKIEKIMYRNDPKVIIKVYKDKELIWEQHEFEGIVYRPSIGQIVSEIFEREDGVCSRCGNKI